MVECQLEVLLNRNLNPALYPLIISIFSCAGPSVPTIVIQDIHWSDNGNKSVCVNGLDVCGVQTLQIQYRLPTKANHQPVNVSSPLVPSLVDTIFNNYETLFRC